MKFYLALLTCGVLAACSTTVNLPEPPVYHPAHAEAMAAPPPGSPTVMAATSPPVADPGLPIEHTAHTGHDSMPGADASQTHVHKTEVSTAVRHPDPGEPTMRGEPSVMYSCQVHPDAMSQTPGQCPQCGLPLFPRMPEMMSHGQMDGQLDHEQMDHGELDHADMQAGEGAQAAIRQAGMPLYACPHHPEIISSFAGPTCPKCGMSLELVEGENE